MFASSVDPESSLSTRSRRVKAHNVENTAAITGDKWNVVGYGGIWWREVVVIVAIAPKLRYFH